MIDSEVLDKKNDEQPIYFTMSMPDWFINLDYDEKIRLVKKMAETSKNSHVLTDEELSALMPSSVK